MEKTEKENTLLSSSALSKLAIIETCNTCNPFYQNVRNRSSSLSASATKPRENHLRELYFRIQPNFSLLSIN